MSNNTKKIPYTAETFPMWAVWIRRVAWNKNKDKRSISIFENRIFYLTYNGRVSNANFSEVDMWEIAGIDGVWKPFYQEEKPWYKNIPKEGVWCWAWDDTDNKKSIRIITGHNECVDYKFLINYSPDGEGGFRYQNAIPLTEEEKEKYLINYKK